MAQDKLYLELRLDDKQYTSKIEEVKATLKASQAEFQRTKFAIAQVKEEMARAGTPTDAMKNRLQQLKISTGGIAERINMIGASLKGLVVGTVLTALAVGIKKAGDASIKAAAQMEQWETSLSVMLGGLDKARALLGDIEELGAKTPLEMPELIQTTKRLLAFGITADEVVETTRRLGDVSQGQADILERVSLAYGKVAAKGKASLEELNMITEAGVPIIDTLAKQYGVSTAALLKMVSQGKVGFADLKKAMETLTNEGGRFYGMMEKQSQTLNGRLSTLSDSWKMIATDIGKILLPAAKLGIEMMIKLTDFIREIVRNIRLAFHQAAIGFKEMEVNIRTVIKSDGVDKAKEELKALRDEYAELTGKSNVDLKISAKTDTSGLDNTTQGTSSKKVRDKDLLTEAEKQQNQIRLMELQTRKELANSDYDRLKTLEVENTLEENKLEIYRKNLDAFKGMSEEQKQSSKDYQEAYIEFENQLTTVSEKQRDILKEQLNIHREAQEEIKQTAEAFSGGIASTLRQLAEGTTSFRDLFKKTMLDASESIIKSGIMNLFKSSPNENYSWGSNGGMFTSGATGGESYKMPGGILGGIVGLFNNLPKFDAGGIVPGAFMQPQLAVVHGGEKVLRPWDAGYNGNSGQGSSEPPVFVYAPNVETAASAQEVFNVLEKHKDAFFGFIKQNRRRNPNLF